MSKAPESGKTQTDEASDVDQYIVKDPERFALNLARMIEQAGKAASAWAEPREKGEVRDSVAEPFTDMVKTFSKVTEYWLSDPTRALEAQTRLFSGYLTVWSNAISRISAGEEADDHAVRPDPRDKRFQDPEWGRNAFFDFLKQAYLVTSRWAGDLVEHADGLDEHTRHKAELLRQAGNERDFAIQLHPDQSRTVPRDGRQQRRKPGARHEDARRRHRRGQRRPEAKAGGLFAASRSAGISRSAPARSLGGAMSPRSSSTIHRPKPC